MTEKQPHHLKKINLPPRAFYLTQSSPKMRHRKEQSTGFYAVACTCNPTKWR